MSDISLQSRFRGALLGLAAGDALGTSVEFRRPGTFERVTDIVGGGEYGLLPGQWTDDTSMALCLAESLVECGGFDARDQMTRYLRWADEGYLSSIGRCFDIGRTVGAALNRFRETGEPFAGRTDPRTAGNGSLMRLAAVPLFFSRDHELAVSMAGESSRTTHAAAEAVDACRFYAKLIVLALDGASKDDLLSGAHGLELAARIAHVAAGSYRTNRSIRGSGYVVESLEAALWAFSTTDDFRSGCLAAANLGDDADTTAAIYGQLAGAFYGEEGIPQKWRDVLAMKETIGALADRLYGGRV